MAISIVQKQQAPQAAPETDLDKVQKGLAIANSLYGLYSAPDKLEAMKADTKFKEAQATRDAENTQIQRDNLKINQNKESRETDLKNQAAPGERAKTQAEINKLNADAAKARADSTKEKTKPFAAEQEDKLSGHDSTLKSLQDLRSSVTDNPKLFGPFSGRMHALNPYDTEAQTVQALTKTAAQNVGKSLEGGKLTDQDIARYQTILPKNSDTPEVAISKIDKLERMVKQKRASDLDTYKRAGHDTSKFEDLNIAIDQSGQTPNQDQFKRAGFVGSSNKTTPPSKEEQAAAQQLLIKKKGLRGGLGK